MLILEKTVQKLFEDSDEPSSILIQALLAVSCVIELRVDAVRVCSV